MDKDKALRKHLVDLLRGGQAYDAFEDVIAEFTKKDRHRLPDGAQHSAWQIVDHMVRALDDIVEYSDNENGEYEEKHWPDDYWAAVPSRDWKGSIKAYQESRKKLEALVMDPDRDLYQPFPWAKDHTLLREILVAADHQAHHIGQLVELERWLRATRD
jgi:hypothetical protein